MTDPEHLDPGGSVPPAALASAMRPLPTRQPRVAPRPTFIDPPGKYALYSIGLSLLDFVMRNDGQALFEPRHSSDPPNSDEPPYRATVFWPVLVAAELRLYPFIRAKYGGIARDCDSPLYFLCNQYEQYAGAAWSVPGTPVYERGLRTLADEGGSLERWRQSWQERGVPDRITDAMGRHANSYLTRVRSVGCICADTPYGPIVLCIESTRPNGFGEDALTADARRLHGNPGKLLCHVADRASDHCDFWTWVLDVALPVKVGAVALAALPGIGWVTEKSIQAASSSAVSWLGSHAPLVLPASLVLLGLGILPHEHRACGSSSFAERTTRFLHRWQFAWVFLFLAAAGIAVRSIPEWAAVLPYELLDIGIPLAVLAAALAIFGCYLCLTRFPPPRTAGAATNSEASVTRLSPGIFVPAIVLAVMIVAASFVPVATPEWAALQMAPAATAIGMALCLLTGRLDSRLMGTPGVLVAMLYANAMVYPLVCVLASFCPEGLFGDQYPELAEHAHALLVALTVLLVPLTIGLLAVICWSIRGRALERYFLNIERVTLAVPRRRFWDAWSQRSSPVSGGSR